ncbi:MAG: hypothetical protein HWE27_14220 [Gammaproteobacteria bacterium]|nr:hypothetical protein [Gammaproteobacteria bacterium]
MNSVTPENSIGSKFDDPAVGESGDWQFVFNETNVSLYLQVNLNDKNLSSELNKTSVEDLIQWLSRVQNSMQG